MKPEDLRPGEKPSCVEHGDDLVQGCDACAFVVAFIAAMTATEESSEQ